jgi:hypothetical protein
MADPAFYQLPGDAIAAEKDQLQNAETDLQAAYQRWEALEQLRQS